MFRNVRPFTRARLFDTAIEVINWPLKKITLIFPCFLFLYTIVFAINVKEKFKIFIVGIIGFKYNIA